MANIKSESVADFIPKSPAGFPRNMHFAWRRRYGSGTAEAASVQLVPVAVTPDQPIAASPARSDERVEIELAGGYRVRVGNGVTAAALRLVLDVLERR
jgi:transposase